MGWHHGILAGLLRPWVLSVAKKRLSPLDGRFKAPGLKGKVEIRRDAHGVPHISASCREDLFFAQGFVHAQDRFWQMEVNRRLARGQLAEVFGPEALDTDRLTRTLGFDRLAKKDFESLETGLKDLFSHYVRGVNAWLQQDGLKLPVEFKLAKIKPRPWEAIDSLAFSRLVTLQLSMGWTHELLRMQLFEGLSEEEAAELDWRYPDANPATLPLGIETNFLEKDGKLRAFAGPFMLKGGGSNAWAITGAKSKTGKAVLCSDPHLPALLPAIWAQIHLKCPDYHCIGVSLPGVPLVLIGHNDRIAWGITLSYTDIEDLYIEKFHTNGTDYKFKGEWKQAKVIKEAIKVKGKADHIEEVLITRHGPVLCDTVVDGSHKMALSTPALSEGLLPDGWYRINLAQNWDEFVGALEGLKAPGLNIIYSDVDQNIGYYVTGESPIRTHHSGAFPAEGWTGEQEWAGSVPFTEMPHSFNPERGFVLSCNHKIVKDDFPHFLGNIWMNGYRARRLEQLLTDKNSYGIEDFKRFHMDVYSYPGLEFAKHFQNLSSDDPETAKGIEILLSWDGHLTSDSIGGAIYQVCRVEMLKLILQKKLGKRRFDILMGAGLDPVIFANSEYLGQGTVVLLEMLKKEDSVWVKQAGGKGKVLLASMKRSVAYLKQKLGNNPKDWKWGKLHTISFPHAFSVKPPMDRIFNLGPLEMAGDTDTVAQMAFVPHEPYEGGAVVPSYRQIIDMGDFSQSVWVMPPGASGQLGSPHYGDQVDAWQQGRYFPMLWTDKQVKEGAKNLFVLE